MKELQSKRQEKPRSGFPITVTVSGHGISASYDGNDFTLSVGGDKFKVQLNGSVGAIANRLRNGKGRKGAV